MSRITWNAQTERLLLEMNAEGKSRQHMAQVLNFPFDSIGSKLKRMGVRASPNRVVKVFDPTIEPNCTIMKMWNEGRTQGQIMDICGMEYLAVHAILGCMRKRKLITSRSSEPTKVIAKRVLTAQPRPEFEPAPPGAIPLCLSLATITSGSNIAA